MADDIAPDDLDQALDTAVRRTADLQETVHAVIRDGQIPPHAIVAETVHRAEDVKELATDVAAEAQGD